MIDPEYELACSTRLVEQNIRRSKVIFYYSFAIFICSTFILVGMLTQNFLIDFSYGTINVPAYSFLAAVILCSLYLSIGAIFHTKKSIRDREYGQDLFNKLENSKYEVSDNASRI